MRLTINGEINLEVEASAEVSSDENAGALIVSVRVKDGNGWKDLNITSALSENDKAMLLVAIEDEYRDQKNAEKDFGKDEAG